MTDRTINDLTREQLTQITKCADTMLSDKYRNYLPGRLLPMLLGRFRDDATEALGIALPERPRGSDQPRQVSLDELTSSELRTTMHVTLTLLTYADTMDDPGLPELLREFRESLVRQQSERDAAASKFTGVSCS